MKTSPIGPPHEVRTALEKQVKRIWNQMIAEGKAEREEPEEFNGNRQVREGQHYCYGCRKWFAEEDMIHVLRYKRRPNPKAPDGYYYSAVWMCKEKCAKRPSIQKHLKEEELWHIGSGTKTTKRWDCNENN